MSERKETLLWPRPRELALTGGSLPLDAPLALRCDTGPDWLPAAARLAAQSLNRLSGRRLVSTRRTAGPELHIEAAPRRRGRATAESYTLHITRRAIRLAAALQARGHRVWIGVLAGGGRDNCGNAYEPCCAHKKTIFRHHSVLP